MQRILLIANRAAHVATAEEAVRLSGRDVRTEPTVERGLVTAREWRPQLVLIDLDIGLSAGGLAALLRDPQLADGVAVIAIVTPERLEQVGPGVEVDDLILAPLDGTELQQRIARTLWERTGADDSNRLRRGALLIDLERYQVSIDGDIVDLTYKEYELLCFLASNPGKPFTREALLNRVWGYDYYGGSRTVDVHVRRIRSKIDRTERFIETVRNVGYRFADRDAPLRGPPGD